MPLFAVMGIDPPPHAMARRDAARGAHRAYVVENDAPIAFVGVCLDEADNQCASIYIFEAESEREVHEWLGKEPFVQQGVYEQLIVRRFMLGVNRLPGQDWPVQGGG